MTLPDAAAERYCGSKLILSNAHLNLERSGEHGLRGDCSCESRQESSAAEQGRAGAQQLLAGVREELCATRQMLEGEQAQCTRYRGHLSGTCPTLRQ